MNQLLAALTVTVYTVALTYLATVRWARFGLAEDKEQP